MSDTKEYAMPSTWIPFDSDRNTGYSDDFDNDGRQWRIKVTYYYGAVVSFQLDTSKKIFFEQMAYEVMQRKISDQHAPGAWMDFGHTRIMFDHVVCFQIEEIDSRDAEIARKYRQVQLKAMEKQIKDFEDEQELTGDGH